jgi:hypothetical protein
MNVQLDWAWNTQGSASLMETPKGLYEARWTATGNGGWIPYLNGEAIAGVLRTAELAQNYCEYDAGRP